MNRRIGREEERKRIAHEQKLLKEKDEQMKKFGKVLHFF